MPRRQTFPFVVLTAFVAVFLAPLVVLFSTPINALPVKFVPADLFSSQTLHVLLTTVFVAGVASVFRTPLMFLFGWLVNRTNVPGRRIFDAVGLYGMTVPDVMKAVGWLILLNPVNGLINSIFLRLFHAPLLNIFTPAGLAFACIWSDLPFEYLMASAAIKNLDPALEEMSRASGHSILRTFVSVVLPSLRQIFVIVFVVGFMITFTGFDQAIILAPPGGYNVMSTYIYKQFNLIPPNYSAAATLGILFLLFALGIFTVYLFLTRKTFMFQTVRGIASRQTVHNLTGAGRWGAFGFCSFIILMTFGLPFIALVWLALTIPGRLFVFSGLTNFAQALHISLFDISWINSLVLGIVVSAITIPLVVVMAYGVFRSRFRASRLLEYVVILPRGIPSIVYGLAVFLMFILVPGLNNLFGTIVPFVLAIVIVTCPIAILIVSGTMVQIGDELEDASRVGGASWSRTFLRVIVPLTKRAILNSIQYAFIGTFNNVASVVLLVTPSFYLLLPLLLGEIPANPAAINYVSAASVLVTIFLSLFIVSMKVVERRLGGGREETYAMNIDDETQHQPAVEIRNIRKKFGRVTAVDGFSLIIGKGEIVSLLGPSGCGKTTTLRIIAGLDDVTEGEVFIDGTLVASANERVFAAPEKRNVGLVFQNFALWPHMTVRSNIDYCLKSRKLPKVVRKEKIQKYLELVNLLEYQDRYPSQLSGGEQQRIALARALAYEPKVLLMDEPLSNIDMKDRERVRNELRIILKKLGISVLHVTHDQSESFALADKVVVMNRGKVMQEGKPVEIYERPQNLFVAQFIGRSNVFKGVIHRSGDDRGILSLDGTGIKLVCDAVGSQFSDDEALNASFRPGMIQLSQSKPEFGENVILGEVTEAGYLGESYEYKFAAEGLRFTVSVNRSSMSQGAVSLGKSYLYIPRDSIYLLKD